MTKEELEVLLPEWQKRLRLQDWDIKLVVHEASSAEVMAGVKGSARYHAALVNVVINPTSELPLNLDPEVSLVHELLHVQAGHLTQFLEAKKRRRYYDEMERLVEMAALALVTLKRAAQQKEQPALKESRPPGSGIVHREDGSFLFPVPIRYMDEHTLLSDIRAHKIARERGIPFDDAWLLASREVRKEQSA